MNRLDDARPVPVHLESAPNDGDVCVDSSNDEWSLKLDGTPPVGRPKELDTIWSSLMRPLPSIVVIEGGPGSGKTTLALQTGQRFEKDLGGPVWLVEARRPSSPLLSIIASYEWMPSPSLLIVDALDELRDPKPIFKLLRSLLERHPALRILATSRFSYRPAPYTLVRIGPLHDSQAKELLEKLTQSGEAPPKALIALAEGNPLILQMIGDLARGTEQSYASLLQSLTSFHRPGLLGPDGHPIGSRGAARRRLISDVREVSAGLLWSVRRDPDLVFSLTPRQFESVAAELFTELGYEVTLTPASKDGGKDLYVARNDVLGSLMYYVECKRYAPDRPVGVALVNALTGVVERGRATAGLLMTTSRFTSGARAAQREFKHRLSLRDYSDFKAMLDRLTPVEKPGR